jgi:manganese transport protein
VPSKVVNALKALGPGFIIAAVVLGPGSITTASRIGSVYGYALLWVIVFAAIGMGTFTTMAGRFGVSHEKSILQAIAENYGRWFAVLIGVAAFAAATSFQFGNNLGVATAMKALTGTPEYVWPLIFTPLGLLLVFFTKNLYKVLEKMIMILVSVMILAFLANLLFAKPNLFAFFKGFIPLSAPSSAFNEMAALVGTTFVLHACLYHSYLVQDKGWTRSDLKHGMRDTVMGIIILAGVTGLVITTSAAALYPEGIMVKSAADMAIQLEKLFGPFAKYIFSFGLWAAAFSSLVVNAIMAGGLLSDGLGLGRSMQEKAPKIFTALTMIIGMVIAVFFKGDVVYALILAQATSLFGVPAIGIGLFLLLNNKKVMGDLRNTVSQNIIAIFGLVLICIMVYLMWSKLLGYLGNLL